MNNKLKLIREKCIAANPEVGNELLPRREIFQDEMPTATKHASKRSEREKEQIEHGAELYQNRGRTQ
jgi:hypothetical protein